jgi:phosphate starvation-inducible PhoH-like protein
MIITGDVTQVDLAANQKSGMVEAIEILRRVDGIGVVELSQQDIVRHRLVQNIVEAYRIRQEARTRAGERERS